MDTVAFYLPQYHVIPENEAIYGKYFTEWNNVRNARPLFPGHLQPRIPHPSIGYYTLLDESFLTFQHELAYENGITGFCYYYYNFYGKRLLEKPLDIVNQSKSIKNKFCLCWDPQNWYNNRNNQKEIFIEQKYSPQIAKIIFSDLLQYITNDHYIKVNGKPLISIFAPERYPLMREYAEIWQAEAIKHGLPGLWLAGVQAFEPKNPYELGLDGMIEFAPNWIREAQITPDGVKPRRLEYTKILRFMLSKDVPQYPFLRCVFPEWDNTPRRGKDGVVVTGTSPELFKTYLECMREYTESYLPSALQYVFINAWNEWGETCYLEPDQYRGSKYLDIIRQVMKETP